MWKSLTIHPLLLAGIIRYSGKIKNTFSRRAPMWFMNKLINPLVRLILRSPLHGLMSGSVLLIIYCGRKSGKEYTLPVQYVRDGNTIYIVPGMPEKKTWWRNLRGGEPVRLLIGGKTLVGDARIMENGATGTVPALEAYFKRYPGAARMRNLRPNGSDTFNLGDLSRLAQSTVVVEVKLT
jgi:deazaflavin-dependent oxidoreductase (nitroreductase family)